MLDRGSVVDVSATVRNSVLAPRTHIGARAHLERVLTGFGAIVGAGARIADGAVLGDEASVSADRTLPSDATVGVRSSA